MAVLEMYDREEAIKEIAKAKSKQKSKSSEALFTPSFSAMRKDKYKEDITFTKRWRLN